MIERRLLAIYLNDHLAGATGGVELARRARSSNRGTKWGEALEGICAEIEADRAALEELQRTLGSKLSEVDLSALIKRAESQRQAVERLRLDAAAEALAEESN